jgi:hypothetical protein
MVWLDHMVVLFLVFWKIFILISSVTALIYTPTISVWVSCTPCSHQLVFVLLMVAILTEMEPQCSLVCIWREGPNMGLPAHMSSCLPSVVCILYSKKPGFPGHCPQKQPGEGDTERLGNFVLLLCFSREVCFYLSAYLF